MGNKKLKMYYNFVKDSWEFFKKYSDVKNTEEYWQSAMEDSQKLAEKYGKTKFVIHVLKEILLELDRCGKEKGHERQHV